ncbi:MAG: diaminopropionate ammonia-lyase [Tissierellia bacterium]|nr:diaminopropionate ammonia-lyase [Tissierellia bacterium]
MSENFKFVQTTERQKEKYNLDFLNVETAKKIKEYHESFPIYEPTPLVDLKNLANYLGVKDVLLKDESYRFGLNAFKVLGGSYAIGEYIAEKLGKDISELSYEEIISDEVRKELGDLTFITATDGNHGRGVAWTANLLKQNCIVYMPHGSAEERVKNIEAEGAEVTVQDMNYDACVRLANENAEKNGWVMVQDTAWDGYEDIPKWIMQGYMTMAYEAYEKMEKEGKRPTHIFLQAGVGSLAAAVTGFFTNVYSDDKPIITIVEPDVADCLYQSACKMERVCVGGKMQTIMAGLACGEPNTVGFEVLMDYAENFISVTDEYAAHGMRILAAPMKGDQQVISGESGAAPLGAIAKAIKVESLKEYKEKMKIDENSVLLFFSTEGDTDQKNFVDVVWDGLYPSDIK